MKIYRETQTSWFLVIALAGITATCFLAYLGSWGDDPIEKSWEVVLIAVLLLTPLLIFYNMRTVVDNKCIFIRYGIGVVRKEIELKGVRDVSIVKVPWYWGFGIKYSRKGTLYSIGLTRAVKLDFGHGFTPVMIGSRNPEALAGAINERTGKGRVRQ